MVAFADFIGLFKISWKSEWPELCSGISLLVYYFMVISEPLISLACTMLCCLTLIL
jgi:hypothetical protein